MKKIIILFTLLALLNSCSDINNKDVSSLNLLPIDSELILNINDLTNTKEILSKNKNLSSISFSKSKVLLDTIIKSLNKEILISKYGKRLKTTLKKIDDL